MPAAKPDEIIVSFGDATPIAVRGVLLLEFERMARRETHRYTEVFAERMEDDSKLRRFMTPEERKKI